MGNEKRHNWKQEVADNTLERKALREALLVEKERVAEQLQRLTMAERRSSLYDQLKASQAEINAKLATL